MFVHVEIRGFYFTALLHKFYWMTYGMVFYSCADDLFYSQITNTAEERHIVCFSATRSKENLTGLCPKFLSDTLPYDLDFDFSSATADVGARGVSKILHHTHHFILHPWFYGCGGCVIQENYFHAVVIRLLKDSA